VLNTSHVPADSPPASHLTLTLVLKLWIICFSTAFRCQ